MAGGDIQKLQNNLLSEGGPKMKQKSIMVLLVCAMLYGVNVNAAPVEVIPPQNKVLGNSSGRFVFGQISDFRSDQFLLDTQTGRLWQIVVDDKKSKSLQIVPFNHVDGSVSIVPEDIQNAVVQILMKQAAEQEKTKGNK
jgi:hypothetical protein